LKYHRYNYRKNPNKKLGNAIEEYGWGSFKVEILEECTRENVRDRERFFIESLNAVEDGYNMTEATKYSDWMKDYNAKMWQDDEYRKERSAASSAVQKKRLTDPVYLAEKSAQLKRHTDAIKKPVGMFLKDGTLLQQFNGIREAERWLLENDLSTSRNSSSAIADCCKGGRHKTVYGYVWKYI
jgi:group I intron endonuclease